jgi:hypothetical protein
MGVFKTRREIEQDLVFKQNEAFKQAFQQAVSAQPGAGEVAGGN